MVTQCLFTVVSFLELETLKGEPTWGQRTSSVLGKLNLSNVRVKQVGMPRGLGQIWRSRVILGSVGWFQSVASRLTQHLAHWISSSEFTSLFLSTRLELLGSKNWAWLIFPLLVTSTGQVMQLLMARVH